MPVGFRSRAEQRSHDKAIRNIVAAKYKSSDYFEVHTNPGQERSFPVMRVLYPDIVIVNRQNHKVEAIAEVETISSVSYQERLQWLDFAKTRLPFYLFVPAGSYKNAADIVKRARIRVEDIIPYNYRDGKIRVGAIREKGCF